MRKLSLVGLIVLAALIIGIAYAEQITLSTYYPAPFGVYNEMRAKRMAVGSTYLDGGAVSVDDDNLIVEGNVGIGTDDPKTTLDVNGLIRTARYSITGNNGPQPPSASADNKAATFYNLDDDKMYYSTGSSWETWGGPMGLFSSWTNKDTDSNTLVKNAVYKAVTDGFVVLKGASTSIPVILTDSSNPPTIARTGGVSSTGFPDGAACPVKKDDYWKVIETWPIPSGSPTIYWLPIGSGGCERQE